jgi:phosphatidylinositol glycan class B
MIFGLLAWLLFIRKVNIGKLALLLVSMLIMVGVGIVIDRWFYGEWTLTVWNYFTENILHGKANAFGTEPWYTYVSEALVRLVPPFSLVFILAPIILIFMDRRNALGWVILPFILVHSMIGHKEIRFLFPMVGLLPVVIVQAIETGADTLVTIVIGQPSMAHHGEGLCGGLCGLPRGDHIQAGRCADLPVQNRLR